MFKKTGELNYNVATSTTFSFIMLLSLCVYIGPYPPAVIIYIQLILVANIFFLKWNSSSLLSVLVNATVRSIMFVIAIYFIRIGKIKIFGGGQAGSGEALHYSGKIITPLGYWGLLKSAVFLGLFVFFSAIIASSIAIMIPSIKRNRK